MFTKSHYFFNRGWTYSFVPYYKIAESIYNVMMFLTFMSWVIMVYPEYRECA